ncbi:MAG: hypothetical protein ACI8YQ_002240 [Polaribacter sp.]|jgi:uncharacterized protein (DUF1684 family)
MKNTILLLFLFAFANTLFAQSNRSYKKEIKEHRKDYKADFLKEERSPFYGKKKALKKMRFYKANKSYKVECQFQRTEDAKPFDMATYSGKVKTFIKHGIISFEIAGQKQELSIYRNMGLMRVEAYANHLFLPFKDKTNDIKTYGGGRYIDLEVSDIVNGKVTIDFNKCYNPWCAFSGGYNCPVPPKENHLTIEMKVGEKKFKGKKY